MGKSSKKIKSDRINALRKQYDSFLEEDKKRKERNEYILGKLDKMTYTSALVPARNKSTAAINRPSSMYHIVYPPERPTTLGVPPSTVIKHQLSPNIPIQKVDDRYLIKEISKNYILIPKLRSPENNYLQQTPIYVRDTVHDTNRLQATGTLNNNNAQQSSADVNSDWKSKYEILNILKKQENDKQSLQFASEVSPKSEFYQHPQVLDNTNIENHVNDNIISDGPCRDFDDLPLKDIPRETANCTTEILNTVRDTPFTEPDIIYAVNPNNVKVETVANIEYQLQNTNLECDNIEGPDTQPPITDVNIEQSEYTENIDDTLKGGQIVYGEDPAEDYLNQPQYYAEAINPTSEQINYAEHFSSVDVTDTLVEENNDNQGIDTEYVEQKDVLRPEISLEQYNLSNVENQVYVVKQDEESVDVLKSNELLNELNYIPNMSETAATKNVEYEPDETGFQASNTSFQMRNSPDDNYKQTAELVDSDVVDSSVKQQPFTEGEAKHQEDEKDDKDSAEVLDIQAFDDEQREMFYSEHPAEGHGYEQDVSNTGEQQIPQNDINQDNYMYYGGTIPLHQQSYGVEVDDEEAKLQYDQSYHQQYQDPYEKAYDQQQPNYENTELYEQMQSEQIDPVYESQSFEKPEQIQSVLDDEEGYIEPTPEVVSQLDLKKGNTVQINPEAIS